MRNLKVSDYVKAMKLELPNYSPVSISNSKFMKALMSPYPFTLILQRGFRQYGQPNV